MMGNDRLGVRGWACASVLAALGSTSCGSDPAGPADAPRIEFSESQLDLGEAQSGHVLVSNPSPVAVGPVLLSGGAVRDSGGNAAPGSSVRVSPDEIPTLNAGESASVSVSVAFTGSVQPGAYDAQVLALVPGGPDAELDVRFRVAGSPLPEGDVQVVVAAGVSSVRQGDVTPITAQVRGSDGELLPGVPVHWSVVPASAGFVTANGQFVAYEPGTVHIAATAGTAADTVELTVSPRSLSGEFAFVGEGVETQRYTSDLWVHGDVAYTGTWTIRVNGGAGNALYAWNVADPTRPVKTSTLTVDARTVNDVKVRADGDLGIITHEASIDGLNGVTLLDLGDPARPAAITRFTQGLEAGVHNAWLEGDYAYLVVDGSGEQAGLHVLDVSDPGNPHVVSTFYGGSSFLHDVYVREGLAFLSHWHAGMIILDVGNGVAGGSPVAPVEVGRVQPTGGQTHNAWYWPETGYVFVGEEDFSTPGIMHVVDARDLSEPREVATFRVPGATPHNFWLDESRGILYLAWYENGVRALDVTGELLGELDRQGREIAGIQYDGTVGSCPGTVTRRTCTWAPQLHGGLVYAADMNGGLRILEPLF